MAHHPALGTIDLDDLRFVAAVAAGGSFVAAARATRTPTSSVSRAVARFEDALGVRLFQRTSRRVALTHEGARLLERVSPLLDELGAAIDDVADEGEVGGRLRVTAPTASGGGRIAEALASFALAHPRVQVELSLTNAVVDLVEGGYDLAFRGGPITAQELVAQRLWSVPLALGASPAFARKLSRRPLTREQLEALPAIAGGARGAWSFYAADGGRIDVRPRIRFWCSDLRVAVATAARGLGVLCAPVEYLHDAGLTMLRMDPALGSLGERELYAVYPSRRFVPRRVRLAVEWVRRAAPRLTS